MDDVCSRCETVVRQCDTTFFQTRRERIVICAGCCIAIRREIEVRQWAAFRRGLVK